MTDKTKAVLGSIAATLWVVLGIGAIISREPFSWWFGAVMAFLLALDNITDIIDS